MAPITAPAAPHHLPAGQQKKWQAAYESAAEKAKNDNPDNEGAQRSYAMKEANRMLAVAAPKCAEDIDALADWQVLHRGERLVKGVSQKFCVTIDGKKYAFPVAAKGAKTEKSNTPATPATPSTPVDPNAPKT